MTTSRRWVFGAAMVDRLIPVGRSVAVAATATTATFNITGVAVHVTPNTNVYPQSGELDLVVTYVTPVP